MKAKNEISATMAFAIGYMHDNGGEIIRHQGGYWANKDWDRSKEHFGTTTIDGLEKRGLIEYSEYKEGSHGKFPIRAKLK